MTPAPTSLPSPTAEPTANAAAKAPVRIVINAIGMDRTIVPVGLDRNRIPIVPEHDVGWFNLSAAPGQSENVVLWGHVLRFRKARNIPAPFAEMKNLKIGEKLELYDDLGVAHDYVVTRQIKVRPTEVKYILQQGREMVTLVSCIGDDILSPDGGVVDKTHRLITIAEPAS